MPPTSSKRPLQTVSETALILMRLAALVILVLFPSDKGRLAAQANASLYQTGFATILYENERDLFAFTRNIGSGLSFLSQSPEKNPLLVRSRVDRIVEMVGTLLDMRPSDLHFSIALARSQEELDAAYHAVGMLGSAPPAFYSHGSRTITVLRDAVTDRMLAHEVAHAIICAYFGAPPPSRTQEVLAQYVDLHLGEE